MGLLGQKSPLNAPTAVPNSKEYIGQLGAPNQALRHPNRLRRRGRAPLFFWQPPADQSGSDWRFEGLAGDRCRVQVEVHCSS
jgi:hypothetical protein